MTRRGLSLLCCEGCRPAFRASWACFWTHKSPAKFPPEQISSNKLLLRFRHPTGTVANRPREGVATAMGAGVTFSAHDGTGQVGGPAAADDVFFLFFLFGGMPPPVADRPREVGILDGEITNNRIHFSLSLPRCKVLDV